MRGSTIDDELIVRPALLVPKCAESVTLDEIVARTFSTLTGRIDGPLALRLVIQPIVAAALAVRAGVRTDVLAAHRIFGRS